jgi:Sigma-54, DNA binding domain/GAF domain/Bacterial regulatory protein, Fis family
MAPQDNLEHYEASEAQDLTRLLRAVRPPAREVQVPPPVDLTIRAAIWQGSVRRQLSTLLALAHRDLARVLRQALRENPLLEEGTSEAHTPWLTAAVSLAATADLAVAERYDSVWQACVPDGWEAPGLPVQASEAPSASERPAVLRQRLHGFESGPPEALVPDVIVRKVGHDYQARLNDDGMPRLRLSPTSRRLVCEGHMSAPEAMQDLDDQLRAAVWLLRGLEYRRRALSAVAQSLVTRQRAFLDQGPAHLQPLALPEVAEALGLHASVVQCVIANTYLSTAHGMIALTEFFQRCIESSGGETVSSPTVKDRIKTLLVAEDPAQPLTDQQLVEVLAAEHIHIARRVVTQYRRALQLPSASRRRSHGSATGASRLSPGEEQRVRQALEAPASRPHRQAWLQSRPSVPDPVGEMRAAYRDLQTALAHPQLRPAVVLALRAFAQAAQAGAPAAPVADTLAFPVVELGPNPRAEPDAAARASGHDLNDLLHLNDPVYQAIRRAVALLDVERVSILLLDDARQELYFVAEHPRPGHEPRLREVHFPATQGIAGWVVREGRSQLVPDVDHDPRFYRGVDVQAGTQTRSLLCVPLRIRERILGVLEAINKRQGEFTANDVWRLEAFAAQLAPALEQARMVQARACRDVQPLITEAEHLATGTGLFDPLVGESSAMQAGTRCQGPAVTVQELPQALWEQSRAPGSSGDAFRLPPGGIDMCELEKELIRQALEQAHQNTSQAAKLLGLSRPQLRARMRRYGLE